MNAKPTDDEVRYITTMVTMPNTEAGFRAAINGLRSNDPTLRLQAAQYLQVDPSANAFAAQLKEEIEPPIHALMDANIRVRKAATQIIRHYGEHALEAIPTLVNMMEHGTVEDKHEAIRSLGVLGALHPKKSAAVLELLVEQLDSKDINIVSTAFTALKSYGAAAAAAYFKLLKLIPSGHPFGWMAIEVIGNLRNRLLTLPVLLAVFCGRKPVWSHTAAVALRKQASWLKWLIPDYTSKQQFPLLAVDVQHDFLRPDSYKLNNLWPEHCNVESPMNGLKLFMTDGDFPLPFPKGRLMDMNSYS